MSSFTQYDFGGGWSLGAFFGLDQGQRAKRLPSVWFDSNRVSRELRHHEVVVPDLFTPQNPERVEQKRRYYATAARYAKQLPETRGRAHRQCYELMRSNLLAALRA